MTDGIFFINSALGVKHLSIFSQEERFADTLKTVESIDKYCPSNIKFMLDSSPVPVEKRYLEELKNRDVRVVDLSQNTNIKKYSNLGHKSIAECLSFHYFLEWFNNNLRYARRIYKLSGRYQLNENFKVIEEIDKSFIFAKAQDSWMSDDMKSRSGAEKFYNIRLWSMDYGMLSLFQNELKNILLDCERYSIDIEHSFYKNLKKHPVREVEKIGVCGKSASDGEYIDE